MDCEVLLGVTGGVAAYKSAALASQLVQAGAGVTVVMTQSAQQFVGAATFAALTGRPVASDLFDPTVPLGAHITLAERADLFCVAPATANFMAKAAGGMADDLVSTLYLSFTGTVLLAPAMNHQMWGKGGCSAKCDPIGRRWGPHCRPRVRLAQLSSAWSWPNGRPRHDLRPDSCAGPNEIADHQAVNWRRSRLVST